MAGVLSGSLYAQAPPLPSRVLRPDEQLHQNQPFYVPNIQPLFPYQWSMPTPYAPYGGFHGLDYGMMPLLLPPPCLEVPGYMISHAQLPILDYRRMTPHVAPTIAHQTHRSHFQNSVPVGRVMVSSEVQTEPLCHSIDSHGHAARSQTCSESGRGSGCGSPVSTSPCSSDNKLVACPEGTSTLTQNCNATNTIDLTGLSAVPKSEVLQAERGQIKCNEMPSGLKIFQNMELVSQNETDLLQCSLASVQSSEDVVLCSYQSLAVRNDKRKVEAGMLRYSSKHCIPVCTEVTVLRTSPSCSTFKTYPKPSRSVVIQSLKAKKKSEMPFHTEVKKDGNSSNVPFKILRLPFDIQYHNQPCQLEASIWSVESFIPYVPSREWMIENGLLTPQKPLSPLIEPSHSISKLNCVPVAQNLRTDASTKYHGLPHQLETSIWSVESLMPYVPSSEWMTENGLLTPQTPLSPLIEPSDIISKPNYIPVGKHQQTDASTKYHGLPHQLEASTWSVESLMPYVPSNEWMVENGFLTPQKPLSPQIKFSDVLSELNQSSTNGIPVGQSQQTGASTKREDSLRSLKAHSPYRPSTSWLADFGNVYYYSKLPIVQQQPNISERRLPKMSLAISHESSPIRKGKETRNQRPAIGVSDQKHGSSHTCKCKAKSSPRLTGSVMTCGWVSHSTLEKKLPFCTSCRYNMKGKDHRKLSFSDGLCCKREENAEMITFDDKRATEGVHDIQNIILGSGKCCAAYQRKIRDQTGLFENNQCLNASPAQDKCVDFEWRTWKKSGEDCIIDPNERFLQRLQKDNAWKGRMQAPKTERRIQKK
ncbi:uncharacterized protein LOC143714620 [Siphateles boraxobius]|uniref:uncharacterized protein LOC143714620 n=1 Tax=Siphateles boraxobius TaxID=180520 RepID=UPI004063BD6C